MSPSIVETGNELRLEFDWTDQEREREPRTAKERLNREEARLMADRVEEAVVYARELIGQAQERQERQANKRRRPVDFGVGDKVYVTKKAWRTDRPSDKLDYPLAGPYTILKQVGYSFKIELPLGFRMSPIFHASRLRKDPQNPLPGQINDPEEPQEVDGNLKYKVEKLLILRVLANGRL